MIHKYTDFALYEGSSSNPTIIYWNEQLKPLLNKNWTEISTKKWVQERTYFILNFKASEGDYPYYGVIISPFFRNSKEEFLMEDSVEIEFIKKFKTEFWKMPQNYYKNLEYEPLCLGDLQHVKDAEKYNM